MVVIVSEIIAFISFKSSVMRNCLDNIGGFAIAVGFIGNAGLG